MALRNGLTDTPPLVENSPSSFALDHSCHCEGIAPSQGNAPFVLPLGDGGRAILAFPASGHSAGGPAKFYAASNRLPPPHSIFQAIFMARKSRDSKGFPSSDHPFRKEWRIMPQQRTTRLRDTRGMPTAAVRELTDTRLRRATERGLPEDEREPLTAALVYLNSLSRECSQHPSEAAVRLLATAETLLRQDLAKLDVADRCGECDDCKSENPRQREHSRCRIVPALSGLHALQLRVSY
jgi:hypothetical protein